MSDITGALRDSAAARLGVDLRHSQINAGRILSKRCIVEMPTGEGKTLTTVLPAATIAKQNKQVLIATANDYLAARDADWMREIYQDLGVTVGCVTSEATGQQHDRAYTSQVVYGTIREFAFDFLRHSQNRWSTLPSSHAPYRLDALIVDEADSVLIDEARTPLVISAAADHIDEPALACFRWSAEFAKDVQVDDDFVLTRDHGWIALTKKGRRRVLQASMPDVMKSLTTTDILHAVERAVWVNQSIHRDQQYVVQEDCIQIVDENTGRNSTGRSFSGGIHQALQSREGLPISCESEPVARITVQDFVGKFQHLCGLTATAWEDRRELRRVYDLDVRRIAPNQPSKRVILQPIVCRNRAIKWQRIAEETRQIIASGRAVLIGTQSVERSEQLSELFRKMQIPHQLLSAKRPEWEATIVREAGQRGRVTIATNMAGRGTDIVLAAEVEAVGGLHVIVSEPHAAVRIDRQLIGRAARQGDPGTARVYASADDEILVQALGITKATQICNAADRGRSERWLWSKLHRAQRIVSRNHRYQRAALTANESNLADALTGLGLDPHLDPLPR